MHVLVANCVLDGRTGTELHTRDLAVGLQRLGHEVTVWSPALGPVAGELRHAGVRTVDDLVSVPAPPAVVHGNHAEELAAALVAFPAARGVAVCHDPLAWWSAVVVHPRVTAHVAVDHAVAERVHDAGVPPSEVTVIANGVDLDRFPPRREPLPPAPRRALVFSHRADAGTTWAATVRAACAAEGVECDTVGDGAGAPSVDPGQLLGRYDIVFAKARAAREAAVCGAAVVLCDEVGLGPMVTASELEALDRWNFGRRVLTAAVTEAAVRERLARYDPADAARAAEEARRCFPLRSMVDAFVEVYERALAAPVRSDGSSDIVLAALLQRAGHHRRIAEDLAKRLADAEAEITRMRSTRTWGLRGRVMDRTRRRSPGLGRPPTSE